MLLFVCICLLRIVLTVGFNVYNAFIAALKLVCRRLANLVIVCEREFNLIKLRLVIGYMLIFQSVIRHSRRAAYSACRACYLYAVRKALVRSFGHIYRTVRL